MMLGKKVIDFYKQNKTLIVKLLLISIIICIADLYSKSIVFSIQQKWIFICSFFNILKVKNYGISFGIFSENKEIAFYGILVFDFLIMCYLFYSIKNTKNYSKTMLYLYSISFIFGGALGNFIDRIIYGSVRDFIDIHIKSLHWPCFNIADIFICLGVFLWAICEIKFNNSLKK